jgi:hypothetical protein
MSQRNLFNISRSVGTVANLVSERLPDILCENCIEMIVEKILKVSENHELFWKYVYKSLDKETN